MANVPATAVEVPVGAEFERFVSNLLSQLDVARLRYLRRRADDLLNGETETQAPAEDEWEAERHAASARSRRARRAREVQDAIDRQLPGLKKRWGIENVEPIGPERLCELLLAEGIRPEDNEFSREIIAMREE